MIHAQISEVLTCPPSSRVGMQPLGSFATRKRRFWCNLICFLFTGAFGLVPSSAPAEGKSARPNILFIMADDHAAHAIGAYGSKINQTPNIDSIAKAGMRFDNCFVVNSICTPSRAAILTGKYSHINGVTVFNRFDGNQPTVAKMLQAAGYYTGMVGKWHLESDPTGFDYWNVLPGQGKYHDPDFIEMGNRKKIEGYATEIITDLSINFLKNRPQDKPFFLMCHHKAPHRPWEPDEKHAKMYEDVTIPEPETFNDDYKTRSSAATEATMRIDRDLTPKDLKQAPPPGLAGEALKKWKYQRYIKDYLRCIASVDDNVGRLLKFLDDSGLAENTIVIYTSDQGFFLGDHNWFDKRFMYEESLRMPFIVRYPNHIKPATVNKDMILNVDFAPTFLQCAGLEVPKEIQGRSILPLLQGKAPKDWRTSMYYRYYHYPADHRVQPHYGVRSERYKLIYFNKINEWEFYDLKRDPHELKNVYADPAYAKEVQRAKAEMERLRKELNDHDQYADHPPKSVTSIQ
ncbi:sulfatase family protein [Pedosphaera parvula]|uniref:Sulfatase n=1 Tax=Pedosphaera parvula (strain Ellin514) TaxID=320771 RepID=B9XGI2_PEDPL|nr:sulfatase [Pedosphaera parvula Ellin514]